jgi:hypothetical protein
MKHIRLTDQDKVNIVHRYSVGLEPIIKLAAEYGLTRQGVYKMIRKAGVDTTKQGANLKVSCSCCGKEITKLRCQVRKALHLFCSAFCYHSFLKHGNGNPLVLSRNQQRLGRSTVAKYYALKPSDIVHHEDRNDFNNHPSNLRVFANNGDHVRHHRGFTVPILWDGSMV